MFSVHNLPEDQYPLICGVGAIEQKPQLNINLNCIACIPSEVNESRLLERDSGMLLKLCVGVRIVGALP